MAVSDWISKAKYIWAECDTSSTMISGIDRRIIPLWSAPVASTQHRLL